MASAKATKQVMKIGKPARNAGRPRSESTKKAILEATIELLQENSIQAITIEAIAREAGVSKATIYRWWQSKALVVIDAFVENHIVRTPMRHDIDPAEALLQHWQLFARQYAGWAGRIVGQILAEGQSDADVQRQFRERFYYGRRAVVYEAVDRLKKAYPSFPDVETEILTDMLYSSVYFRLLWGHGPLDEKFIYEYPRQFFRLLGIEFDSEGHVQA